MPAHIIWNNAPKSDAPTLDQLAAIAVNVGPETLAEMKARGESVDLMDAVLLNARLLADKYGREIDEIIEAIADRMTRYGKATGKI